MGCCAEKQKIERLKVLRHASVLACQEANITNRTLAVVKLNHHYYGAYYMGIDYRPVIQTRHTFATMMVSSGENLGWIQKMMGHSSLKMITDKYFSYIPNMTHHDGSKFMEEYERKVKKEPQMSPRGDFPGLTT